VRILTKVGLPSLLSGQGLPSDPVALRRIGENLATALQQAGGVFIKLGQVLATRTDVVPPELAEQLVVLQDRTQPVPFTHVLDILTAELGHPVDTLFKEIDPQPLASASIGQVHRATTATGESIVVKVQRPGVDALVRRDIEVLLRLAERLDRKVGVSDSLGVPELARAFARNLAAELTTASKRRTPPVPEPSPRLAAAASACPPSSRRSAPNACSPWR
jgi:ubiquinone biosynthesis protein